MLFTDFSSLAIPNVTFPKVHIVYTMDTEKNPSEGLQATIPFPKQLKI